jgi:hypothetical protein
MAPESASELRDAFDIAWRVSEYTDLTLGRILRVIDVAREWWGGESPFMLTGTVRRVGDDYIYSPTADPPGTLSYHDGDIVWWVTVTHFEETLDSWHGLALGKPDPRAYYFVGDIDCVYQEPGLPGLSFAHHGWLGGRDAGAPFLADPLCVTVVFSFDRRVEGHVRIGGTEGFLSATQSAENLIGSCGRGTRSLIQGRLEGEPWTHDFNEEFSFDIGGDPQYGIPTTGTWAWSKEGASERSGRELRLSEIRIEGQIDCGFYWNCAPVNVPAWVASGSVEDGGALLGSLRLAAFDPPDTGSAGRGPVDLGPPVVLELPAGGAVIVVPSGFPPAWDIWGP